MLFSHRLVDSRKVQDSAVNRLVRDLYGKSQKIARIVILLAAAANSDSFSFQTSYGYT